MIKKMLRDCFECHVPHNNKKKRTEIQRVSSWSLGVWNTFINLVQDFIFNLRDGVSVQYFHRAGLDLNTTLHQHCQSLKYKALDK